MGGGAIAICGGTRSLYRGYQVARNALLVFGERFCRMILRLRVLYGAITSEGRVDGATALFSI